MILKSLIGAAIATWLGLGAWTLNGQAKLGAAVGELRGEIRVLNVTLVAMNERQGHYADLVARVGALERAGR